MGARIWNLFGIRMVQCVRFSNGVQFSDGFDQNGCHFDRISNGFEQNGCHFVRILNGVDKMATILFGVRIVLKKMSVIRKPNTIRKPYAIDHLKSERVWYWSPHCRGRYSISNINYQLTTCQQMLKTCCINLFLFLQCCVKTCCIYSVFFVFQFGRLKLARGAIYF